MAELDPDEGFLIQTTELSFVSGTITAVGFSEVSEWQWTLTPAENEDVNFTFTPSGMQFVVEYFSELDLFPIVEIRYLDPQRNNVQISEWEQLPDPEDSPEMVRLQEDDKDLIDWDLHVKAIGLDDDSSPSPAEAEGNYTLRVFANYDTSRDILIAAVENRKSFRVT